MTVAAVPPPAPDLPRVPDTPGRGAPGFEDVLGAVQRDDGGHAPGPRRVAREERRAGADRAGEPARDRVPSDPARGDGTGPAASPTDDTATSDRSDRPAASGNPPAAPAVAAVPGAAAPGAVPDAGTTAAPAAGAHSPAATPGTTGADPAGAAAVGAPTPPAREAVPAPTGAVPHAPAEPAEPAAPVPPTAPPDGRAARGPAATDAAAAAHATATGAPAAPAAPGASAPTPRPGTAGTDAGKDPATAAAPAPAMNPGPAVNPGSAVNPGPAPDAPAGPDGPAGEPGALAPATAVPARPAPAAGRVEGSPAPAPSPVAPEPPAEQLVRVLRPLRHGPDGAYRLQLELRPPELGRVELRVEVRDGLLNASLRVDNEAAAHAIRDALDSLRQRLEAGGIRPGSLHVDDGRAGAHRHDARDERPGPATAGDDDPPPSATPTATASGRPGTDGTLDVRI